MIGSRHHLPVLRILVLAVLLALLLALALAWRSAAGQARQDAGGWTRIGATGGVGASALARDPAGRLYAGTYYAGLFVTSDDGTTWANPLPVSVASLAVTPGAVYAGTWGHGVYRSTDDGVHWGPANEGLSADDVYALVVDGTTAVFAGTDHGVFKTADGAAHWQATGGILFADPVYALALLDGALYAGTDRGVFVTSDGGATWSSASQGLAARRVLSLAAGGGKLYAGTGGTVQVRSASGQWYAPPIGSPPGPVPALAIFPANGSQVVAGTANGAYVSANGGVTWAVYNAGLSGYALEITGLALDGAAQPPVLYAATGAGVWRTLLEPQEQHPLYLPLIRR